MNKKSDQDKLAIGRHTGDAIWGYEVLPDGRIQLSPGFAERLRSILDRESGLLAMQEGVNRFVASELTRCAKERRDWWNDLADDTGIDPTKPHQFDTRTGSVSQQEDAPAPPASAQRASGDDSQ